MPTRRVMERGPEGFGVHAPGSPLTKSCSAGLAFWFLTVLLCLLSDARLVPEFLSQGPNKMGSCPSWAPMLGRQALRSGPFNSALPSPPRKPITALLPGLEP